MLRVHCSGFSFFFALMLAHVHRWDGYSLAYGVLQYNWEQFLQND